MFRRASWGHFGPSWGSLRPSWNPVVPSWGSLGLPGSPFRWLWGAMFEPPRRLRTPRRPPSWS
eukprot:1967053-Pyramimonas_sp.AAC.1